MKREAQNKQLKTKINSNKDSSDDPKVQQTFLSYFIEAVRLMAKGDDENDDPSMLEENYPGWMPSDFNELVAYLEKELHVNN